MIETLFEGVMDSLVRWRWWRRLVFALLLTVIIYLAGFTFNGIGVWLIVFLIFELMGWYSARKA